MQFRRLVWYQFQADTTASPQTCNYFPTCWIRLLETPRSPSLILKEPDSFCCCWDEVPLTRNQILLTFFLLQSVSVSSITPSAHDRQLEVFPPIFPLLFSRALLTTRGMTGDDDNRVKLQVFYNYFARYKDASKYKENESVCFNSRLLFRL